VTTDENGRYSLGVRSFEVGSAYLRDMTPARAVEEELRTLTRDLSVTAHFAVLDGAEVVYLVKHDPPGTALQLASSLGVRLPAEVTAVGKAQLAFRPEAASARRGGPAESVLAQVRSNGYAFDEGETAVGIRCVAAPVFDERGCCGAIGVSYLIPTGLDAAEVAQHVMRAGANASARLGGRVWTGAA
jgi:DNA-binding IclR family transcriptional regulator